MAREWVWRTTLQGLLLLALLLASGPASAQGVPTNDLVRKASMRALEKLGDPAVEIITQGSRNLLGS